jgi:excinuclease UvrABC nuclease subunit
VRCQREASPAELPVHTPRPTLPPASVAEAMLATVPGISTVGARALLERFGSVAGVIEASEDELLAIPGLGPARVQALLCAFGRAVVEIHAPGG